VKLARGVAIACGLVAAACAGRSESPASAPVEGAPRPPPPDAGIATESAEASDAPARSVLCEGLVDPRPCRSDRPRAGRFVDGSPCLALLDPAGSGDGDAMNATVRAHSGALGECLLPEGAPPSSSGHAILVRVLTQPGAPPRVTVIAPDLDPAVRQCVERAAAAIPFASGGTNETTLRLAVVTRRWVDDPSGGCPE
jgi:hypothetical protein